MRQFIEQLKRENELTVIDQEVDINLEIAHLAYAEVKKEGGGKALLFTHPVSGDRKFDVPVLINLYGSKKRTEMIFGTSVDGVANEVQGLLHLAPPKTFGGKIAKLFEMARLRHVFPKRLKGSGACQEVVQTGDSVRLSDLPVLTTWPEDGGPFITMGQVYTKSLDGKLNNVGMYRLQVYDDRTLGLHWQIHKDSSNFFNEYEKAGERMPVSIAIGGDPLYTWCGTAPLPKGLFELMLYGFVRRKPARLVKCKTNDLYVPEDADYVIEGWVENPKERRIEGPFGDHTGYYTLQEPYPVLNVTAITRRKKPIYLATVVGKPPIEDKYMGWPTERIFLPLLRTNVPELIDYRMPENGVFHNLIIAKLKTLYPGHALQAMHSFWGVGQMSFVKNAIFVDESAPDLSDDEALFRHILQHLSPDRLLISSGVLDALDHSSPKALIGGKLGIDATGEAVQTNIWPLSDADLFAKAKALVPELIALKQYGSDTPNPVTLLQYEKRLPARVVFEKLRPLSDHLRIVIALDEKYNDVENAYMSLWRTANNMDALRDLMLEPFIFIDATNKGEMDGFDRQWPGDTDCDRAAIERLRAKGLWSFDEGFMKRWQL
ncbi:MAG: menaquinone biosynthesis decarboxylase [Campylobacterales bacterium]